MELSSTFSPNYNYFKTDNMVNHHNSYNIDIEIEDQEMNMNMFGKRKRDVDDDFFMRKTKQLVTEEKMTNALKNLNLLETEDKKPDERISFIDDLGDDFDDETFGNDNDESAKIILSDEIKESLRRSKASQDLDFFTSKISEQSKLQLVIWDPKMNISEKIKNNLKKLEECQKKNEECHEDNQENINEDSNSQYTVEEPKEFDYFKKSLKRSYEESNRILIEEIEDSSNSSNDSPKNYIVDESAANASPRSDTSLKKSNQYQIHEIEEMESMDI